MTGAFEKLLPYRRSVVSDTFTLPCSRHVIST